MSRLCPRLERYAPIPLGLSTRENRNAGIDRYLVLPLLPWFGRRYEINHDAWARGWFLGRLLLAFETNTYPGFALRVRWGSTPLKVKLEPNLFHGWPL